jgi:hypothetical protein
MLQSSAKCRPAKIVGWQVSRKRSSVRQSFAAASALGSGPTTSRNSGRLDGGSSLSEITPYSMTSSARAARVDGTSMPSALAVERLMTSSNLVERTTGKSAGLAPLRMRPV